MIALKKLKIAMLVANFPPYFGGIGNACYHNALELARLGHDITVFTRSYKSNLVGRGIKFYYELIVPMQRLPRQFDFLWLPYLALNGTARFLGILFGKKIAPLMPSKVNRFFSVQKYFWK